MSDPVLFDDGGSTRIKQLRGPSATGRLDDLLEVTLVGGQAQSKDFAIGPFARITISCVNAAGASGPPNLGSAAAAAGTFPIAMALNHTFEIHSGKHRVHGRIVNRSARPAPATVADCEVTVKGTAGIDPIVEAKHNDKQRRYVISNAPYIDRVDVNAAGPVQTFTVPAGTVYTLVILS
jgi:hypothetical protein